MAKRQCYHCKEWIAEGEAHDCWTTTEQALTRGLSEDLQDAYERIRDTAAQFGEQRVYASHNSIMFSRKACYFFVRPQKKYLELCIFLGREVKAPQIRKAAASSKTKFYHLLRIVHRDEVEVPVTDWLREAYVFGAAEKPAPVKKTIGAKKAVGAKKAAKATKAKKR